MNKKRSIVWKLSLEDFQQLVKQSNSITEIGRKLGFTNKANWITIKARLLTDNLDFSHFNKEGQGGGHKAANLTDILVEGSTYHRGRLKQRLIAEKLLENNCAICKLAPEWNCKKLTLILDHINGINDDGRLENLRLLCPNCNSQTDTFTGRNKFKEKQLSCIYCSTPLDKEIICIPCKKEENRPTILPFQELQLSPKKLNKSNKKPCIDCGSPCGTLRCRNCNHKIRFTPIKGISDEELSKLVWEISMVEIGKRIGISANALKGRCDRRNITYPGLGFWAKKYPNKDYPWLNKKNTK